MESPQNTSKLPLIIVLTLSFAAGALGFGLSYQDEQIRFFEMSSVAESHLTYALQLKDDMALIDWSKSLEKISSVLAFKAHLGSKIVADGGNKEMCPTVSSNGLSFDFPYRWTVFSTFNKDSATPGDIIIVFQDFHGPLLWAICLFSITLVTGLILLRLKVAPKTDQLSSTPMIPVIKNQAVTQPISKIDEKSLTLALNADYIIYQATDLAAKALDWRTSDLIGSHFLDLLPDPSVMKVIAEAKEAKFLKPFPSHPHLGALIRPVPEGTLLLLENTNSPERP